MAGFPTHLSRAIMLAEENEFYCKWRLAAVIIKGGSVYSIGYSRLLTDPSQCDYSVFNSKPPKVSLHAEVDALRNCPRASGGVMYVARIGRSGAIGMAKPCRHCQKAISDSGIKRVVYTVSNSTHGTWYPQRGEI